MEISPEVLNRKVWSGVFLHSVASFIQETKVVHIMIGMLDSTESAFQIIPLLSLIHCLY